MSFRKDYSNIKGVYLNGSIECLDTLDYLTHRMRDENCSGLFAYKYDPYRDVYFYRFYNCDIEFPFDSYVYLDKDTNTIFIECNNRLIGFNLDDIKQIIEERKNELYNR